MIISVCLFGLLMCAAITAGNLTRIELHVPKGLSGLNGTGWEY